ncbi:hypothetical protein [Candidatus Uabimicrobium sp. HlEnr_7]|uniref:hypothetical protein n=1 Tax=Candidatus Uabimicrobium helgolandensis TaxID=3095367 RepID=UPI0035578117
MSETLTTCDLWLGGYILSESDAELKDVQVSFEGRESILFSIKGEDLNELAKSYYKQEALANVIELRAKLNFLRDIIFESRRQRKLGR